MSTQPLCRFADCEYSVFVSYAGGDNTRYGQWAIDFSQELNRQLKAELAVYQSRHGTRELPDVHAYEINGLTNGPLEPNLQQRILTSFAMIVIVGPKYIESEACMAELKYFEEVFSAAGRRDRLFIVALDPTAMRDLVAANNWHTAPADTPVYRDFYVKGEIGHAPVPVRRDDSNTPTKLFLDRFGPLRDALVTCIKADLDTPVHIPDSQWLLCNISLSYEDAVTRLVDQMREHVSSVNVLGRTQSIEPWLKMTQNLVIPINSAHAQAPRTADLIKAWVQLQKPPERMHFVDIFAPSESRLTDSIVNEWPDRHLTVQSLMDILTCKPAFASGMASGSSVLPKRVPRAQIWIETNSEQRDHWKVLKEELETHWKALLKEHQIDDIEDFPLLPKGMDMAQVNDFPLDDADGLMLLWGDQRDVRTLLTYINKVDSLSVRRPAPGIVAYLSPPKPHMAERPIALGWDVLRFKQDPPKVPPLKKLAPQSDDVEELRQFLDRVFKRACLRSV